MDDNHITTGDNNQYRIFPLAERALFGHNRMERIFGIEARS